MSFINEQESEQLLNKLARNVIIRLLDKRKMINGWRKGRDNLRKLAKLSRAEPPERQTTEESQTSEASWARTVEVNRTIEASRTIEVTDCWGDLNPNGNHTLMQKSLKP